MEGGIAILLIVIVLVVGAVIGLVMYLSGMSLGAKADSEDGDGLDPVELRVSPGEAERQLTPETRRARRRRRHGPHAT